MEGGWSDLATFRGAVKATIRIPVRWEKIRIEIRAGREVRR